MTNNERKTLLQHMDDLAEWTGFPRFARRANRTRRLKWAPIMVLLLATAVLGAVIALARSHWMGMGVSLLSTFLCFAVSIREIGPLRSKNPVEDSDEREQLWRARSNLFALGAVGLVAWIGLLGFGGYAIGVALAGWRLPSADDPLLTFGFWLVAFALYLMTLFMALPTLHASWTLPDIIEDEPEPRGHLRFVKPRRR